MHRLSRRTFLAAAAAGTVGKVRAAAPEFTLKYGNNVPTSHPLYIRAKEASDRILAETDGRVLIEIFPSSQLGSDTDMLSQLRSGAIDFFTLSGSILATLVPAASMNEVPFCFPTYDDVWKAMDGEFGAYVRKQIDKAGLVAFDKLWDNGFRHTTTSTKPIQRPEDFVGLKIRVRVSPMSTSLFKALGAAPISINASEMYSALQTKIAEAQENPILILSTFKLYEVQKFCSMTGHNWDGFWFLANGRSWDGLPEDLRSIVAKHINAAALAEREDVARLNAGLESELVAKGMVFNRPDLPPFREALRKAGFYGEWQRRFGEEAWSVLEKSTGKLA